MLQLGALTIFLSFHFFLFFLRSRYGPIPEEEEDSASEMDVKVSSESQGEDDATLRMDAADEEDQELDKLGSEIDNRDAMDISSSQQTSSQKKKKVTSCLLSFDLFSRNTANWLNCLEALVFGPKQLVILQ